MWPNVAADIGCLSGGKLRVSWPAGLTARLFSGRDASGLLGAPLSLALADLLVPPPREVLIGDALTSAAQGYGCDIPAADYRASGPRMRRGVDGTVGPVDVSVRIGVRVAWRCCGEAPGWERCCPVHPHIDILLLRRGVGRGARTSLGNYQGLRGAVRGVVGLDSSPCVSEPQELLLRRKSFGHGQEQFGTPGPVKTRQNVAGLAAGALGYGEAGGSRR